GTSPLVAKLGQRVRIRLANLSAMDHHPIHLHGYQFRIAATDGGRIPEGGQWPETTVVVPVGSTRDIEFVADQPGDWALHCHMTHHSMNQMGHRVPIMLGVKTDDLDAKVRQLLPDYMTMRNTVKLLGVAIMVLVPIVALGHVTRLHRGKPTEGEMASVQGDHLSLKTAAGSVPVTLTDETKIERESQQAARADIAPGTHVAV